MTKQQTMSRRAFLAGGVGGLGLALTGCIPAAVEETPSATTATPATTTAAEKPRGQKGSEHSLELDMARWSYDREDDVWYQQGVVYCATPAAEGYESLAIYVPGPYLKGTANDDGLTYSCRLAPKGARGAFTAQTAPVLLPVNGGSYAAEMSPQSYNYAGLEPYLETGFVYVYAGFRGRSNAYVADGSLAYEGCAPWPVVDLKAAVRFLRHNAELLPGNTDQIFAFGLGAGGTLANLLGASGDCSAYDPYLGAIGAATTDAAGNRVSDALYGCASWNAECCLDSADAAYEWFFGQWATGGSASGTRAESTWTCELSRDLARAFPGCVAAEGLTVAADPAAEQADNEGEEAGEGAEDAAAAAPVTLALADSPTGISCAGSYYDYLRTQVQDALNTFLAGTRFPYAEGAVEYLEDGNFPGGDTSSRNARAAATGQGQFASRTSAAITTYATPQDYIAALDRGLGWLRWNEETKKAEVQSLNGYALMMAEPEREAPAYDSADLSSPENLIFGNAEQDASHYSSLVAEIVESNAKRYALYANWNEELASSWRRDTLARDEQGHTAAERVDLFDPMAFLAPARAHYQQSTVAKAWRVHFGLQQDVTPLTMHTNLMLRLRDCAQASNVSSELVWGQGHALCEASGEATVNLIAWIQGCVG